MPQQSIALPKRSTVPRMTKSALEHVSSFLPTVVQWGWTGGHQQIFLLLLSIVICFLHGPAVPLLKCLSAPLTLPWHPRRTPQRHEEKESGCEQAVQAWDHVLHPWIHRDGTGYWRSVHVANVWDCCHDPQSRFQMSDKEKNWCDSSFDPKLVTSDGLSLKVSDAGREPGWWSGNSLALPEVTKFIPVGREKRECL